MQVLCVCVLVLVSDNHSSIQFLFGMMCPFLPPDITEKKKVDFADI